VLYYIQFSFDVSGYRSYYRLCQIYEIANIWILRAGFYRRDVLWSARGHLSRRRFDVYRTSTREDMWRR